MKVGLYFGSFNPIHMGHLIIASYLIEAKQLDQIRLIISPLNPFKESKDLLDHHDRLLLAQAALAGQEKILASDLEFDLPIPSYTIDSLKALERQEPNNQYSLIMGEDNLEHFHKWKEHDLLVEKLKNIFVYPRIGYKGQKYRGQGAITTVDAPIIELSGTAIRRRIKEGESVSYWVHPNVECLLYKKGFYKQ